MQNNYYSLFLFSFLSFSGVSGVNPMGAPPFIYYPHTYGWAEVYQRPAPIEQKQENNTRINN